jgi:virginiamycin B lyase
MPSTKLAPLIALFILGATAVRPCRADDAINEYPLATVGHRPQAIVLGPDGNMWATEVIKKKILKITPDGAITEYAVPGDKVGVLQGIAAGSDGNLWFTSREENAIRTITTKGEFKDTFTLPSKSVKPDKFNAGAWPRVIIAGGDGYLWFSEMAANNIGRISAKGEIKEFPVPTAESAPYGMAVGSDKNIWFTESVKDKIGRLDPATGKIDEFDLPTTKGLPRDLTAGPDGNLWFSMNQADKIGRISVKGEIKEFPLPKGTRPIGIAPGADGNIWFACFGTAKIGRITPEGKVDEFSLKTANAQPFGLTTGAGNTIWFAEQANAIGRVEVKSIGSVKDK